MNRVINGFMLLFTAWGLSAILAMLLCGPIFLTVYFNNNWWFLLFAPHLILLFWYIGE